MKTLDSVENLFKVAKCHKKRSGVPLIFSLLIILYFVGRHTVFCKTMLFGNFENLPILNSASRDRVILSPRFQNTVVLP